MGLGRNAMSVALLMKTLAIFRSGMGALASERKRRKSVSDQSTSGTVTTSVRPVGERGQVVDVDSGRSVGQQ